MNEKDLSWSFDFCTKLQCCVDSYQDSFCHIVQYPWQSPRLDHILVGTSQMNSNHRYLQRDKHGNWLGINTITWAIMPPANTSNTGTPLLATRVLYAPAFSQFSIPEKSLFMKRVIFFGWQFAQPLPLNTGTPGHLADNRDPRTYKYVITWSYPIARAIPSIHERNVRRDVLRVDKFLYLSSIALYFRRDCEYLWGQDKNKKFLNVSHA